MAKKAATGKSLAVWETQLAKFAEEAAASEKLGSGSAISIRGGILSYQGAEIPDSVMNVVILDHALLNIFFTDTYDPDNPQPPNCYAIGRDSAEMIPHENAAEIQNTACDGCPMNEWASADKGRGKACKNKRRLVMIVEGDLDNIGDAEIARLDLPVMSVKAWSGYVHSLAETLHRPPLAVVTEISVIPDAKAQYKVQFSLVREIETSEEIEALFAKREKASTVLFQPFMDAQEAPPPKQKPHGVVRSGRRAEATPRTERAEPAQRKVVSGSKATKYK